MLGLRKECAGSSYLFIVGEARWNSLIAREGSKFLRSLILPERFQ